LTNTRKINLTKAKKKEESIPKNTKRFQNYIPEYITKSKTCNFCNDIFMG
jgi:hypothetical protein